MGEKIIIIEDEALIALELESTLQLLGYQVIAKAMNGDAALDIFAHNKADLVLLDINIKGTLNGIDLARILKEKYDTPYIFITSFADDTTVTEASATMPYGYIVKPFSEKDLRSNIAMALTRARAESRSRGTLDFDLLEEAHDVKLSTRDRDILYLLYTGHTYQETANQLNISINTVKTYQKRLYTSFKVDSKIKLIEKIRP